MQKLEKPERIVSFIYDTAKHLYTIVKSKVNWIRNNWHKSALLTLIIIPFIITQVLNIYNANKADEKALQDALRQISINYDANNYLEVEQDIYKVYPQLQKRKDYKTLLSLSDMLLYSIYQEFYRNHSALSEEKEDLIYMYANNALVYAEKLEDIATYIKICIHMALFNISEYEFTLKTKYLDKADMVLTTAGKYFDENHTSDLLITDDSGADLACQFFNLKNLQYQISYYRAVIDYPFNNSSDNLNQTITSSSNIAQIDPYATLEDLVEITINLIANVYIIEDQNTKLGLIPEDEIEHMKIIASVAYIKTGNLAYDFGGMLPFRLRDETDTSYLLYDYNIVELCHDLFTRLENVARDIDNYEDLVAVYKAAETYYYLNYVSDNPNYIFEKNYDDILAKYEETKEKLLALDPSGDILSPYIIETGNGSILDKYIENAEDKLSKITFGSDPFAFSLLKYKLGTHYLDRALFRDELGDVINAKLDYENARKCYDSALLYFKENAGIFGEITRKQALITEKLSILNK